MRMWKISLMSLILMISLGLVSCKKEVVVEKSFPEIVSELESYILEANFETFFPSGTRECKILVYYKNPSFYRVELTNPNVNEKQIMIKNKDGVFVLIPSINKTFKVNSDWPNNSSQPYLLQSLCHDIVRNENIISSNNGNETTLELKSKIFSSNNETKQIIVFDNKTKLPKEVILYNQEEEVIAKLNISRIETNVSINNDIFVINDTLTSARIDYLETPLEFDRSISYPTYCPEDTKLKEEVITGGNDNKQIIMTYEGGMNFTIVEKYVLEKDNAKTSYENGDIYVLGGCFAIASATSIKFYDAGMEYYLASKTAPVISLIYVAESLRNSEYK